MDQDVFRALTTQEIPAVLEIFERNESEYFPLIQYIKVAQEYNKAEKTTPKQTIYRYGDMKNGVYMVKSTFPTIQDLSMSYIFIYTASEDLGGLRHALTNTSQIPWTSASEMMLFEVIFERFSAVICEVAKSKGVDLTPKNNYMMWLPNPVEPSPVPEDMYLARLQEHHVPEINEDWPHRFPGSDAFLSHQINNNYSVGLFRKSDNKLACSSLTFHSGGIFVLYTKPDFRGKGYAEIIVRDLSNQRHQNGKIPFATILLENIPSQKLFKKIGFQHFQIINFLIKL